MISIGLSQLIIYRNCSVEAEIECLDHLFPTLQPRRSKLYSVMSSLQAQGKDSSLCSANHSGTMQMPKLYHETLFGAIKLRANYRRIKCRMFRTWVIHRLVPPTASISNLQTIATYSVHERRGILNPNNRLEGHTRSLSHVQCPLYQAQISLWFTFFR